MGPRRPPGLRFPAGGARFRHFRQRPRRACGSVRASVYFRPPPPPRAEGRACRAAGPEQPWTGSWGELGGRAGRPGPRWGARGALRAAPVKGVGPGRSGLGGRGASPRGRGRGRGRGREQLGAGPGPTWAGQAPAQSRRGSGGRGRRAAAALAGRRGELALEERTFTPAGHSSSEARTRSRTAQVCWHGRGARGEAAGEAGCRGRGVHRERRAGGWSRKEASGRQPRAALPAVRRVCGLLETRAAKVKRHVVFGKLLRLKGPFVKTFLCLRNEKGRHFSPAAWSFSGSA